MPTETIPDPAIDYATLLFGGTLMWKDSMSPLQHPAVRLQQEQAILKAQLELHSLPLNINDASIIAIFCPDEISKISELAYSGNGKQNQRAMKAITDLGRALDKIQSENFIFAGYSSATIMQTLNSLFRRLNILGTLKDYYRNNLKLNEVNES